MWGFQSRKFIPLFEQNGFITKLDQYGRERAASVLRSGTTGDILPIPVSVNASRRISTIRTWQTCCWELCADRPQPSRLHLEITKARTRREPGAGNRDSGYLRELGFVIEIDDSEAGIPP